MTHTMLSGSSSRKDLLSMIQAVADQQTDGNEIDFDDPRATAAPLADNSLGGT